MYTECCLITLAVFLLAVRFKCKLCFTMVKKHPFGLLGLGWLGQQPTSGPNDSETQNSHVFLTIL